jgi:hypothetical protein
LHGTVDVEGCGSLSGTRTDRNERLRFRRLAAYKVSLI